MVATVEETDGPNQVLRENGQRRIAVLGNTDGRRDMAAIVADIRRITAETGWPQGYVTRLEGTFQAQEEATLRIGALSLISLAMVFVVLYSRYQSPALALIIMGNIPLALIGSVIALNLAGQPLSVASMIGFITLAGISARNGILKVSHYINLALYEGEPFGPGFGDPRQPGAAHPGAHDRALGGPRPHSAPHRGGRAGARDPPSGSRDDLRRAHLGHAHRHLPHPRLVPHLRA
jgi:hypothetical protein